MSATHGKPHDVGPKEPLDLNDVGLDADDGAERNDPDVLDLLSKDPDCLDSLLEPGDRMLSSQPGDCKFCPSASSTASSGDSMRLDDESILLGCQNADSETVDSDSRTPPDGEGILGSIDFGLGVRLIGSALTGDVAVEQTSSLLGDSARRFVKISIRFSRPMFTSSRPSASPTLTRMLSVSHSSSAILASFNSMSFSSVRRRTPIDLDVNIYCQPSAPSSLRSESCSCLEM